METYSDESRTNRGTTKNEILQPNPTSGSGENRKSGGPRKNPI